MTTTAKPTRGRIIEVTSNLWTGKRPGIIVDVGNEDPDGNVGVKANVFLDGMIDGATLSSFRDRGQGNTVELEYGVQNPDPGLTLPLPGDRDWFCGWWMPFQVGQVPASLAVQGDLTGLKQQVATLDASHNQLAATAREACDRLKDALGFLAEKLQKEAPGHPRHGLFSGVMRILDGKAAEDATTNEAATDVAIPEVGNPTKFPPT